jgi:hypothetical protein
MANASLITGKTWDQMNNAEKSAHVIGRGESFNQPFFDKKAGQAWLDNNIGDKRTQIQLFVKARDAAADRIENNTTDFTDPAKIAEAIRLATLAQPATSTPSEFGGVGTTTPATLGISEREPIDTSIYTAINAPNNAYSNENQRTGSWDNNQGYTLYNPETGQYESYAMPDNVNGRNPFVPGSGITSWYYTPEGDMVLGFNPSRASTVDDGTSTGTKVVAAPPQNPPPPPVTPPVTPPVEPPVSVDPPVPVGPPTKPTVSFPDYPPTDYTNVPPPDGDGTFVKGNPPADTTWDWDYFREKAGGDRMWGGYDVDYQAFERYQPGMDSPWGMNNIEGNNFDFYQQQFVNLLRDEQGFDARQRESQRRAQDAYDNPYEAIEMDWSWANNGQGLPEVSVSTGEVPAQSYGLSNSFTTDTTNTQVLETLKGLNIFNNEQDQANFTAWLGNGSEDLNTNWVNQMNNPENNYADQRYNFSEGNDFTGRIFDSIYNPLPLGPVAPKGYAQPVGFGSYYNTQGN